MKRWAVGNVRTGHEFDVADRIKKECGAEVYCPKYTTKGQRRRGQAGRESAERAALPSYLFIRHDTIEDREIIYQDSRFHYFITDWLNRIITITGEVIEEMRSRELLGAYQPRFVSGPVFLIGETVKVPDGPWKSMRGQVIAVNRGRYLLDNLDFTKGVWFSGLQLLGKAV